MDSLAKYIMQGQRQLIIVAFTANAIPFLFWLGSAAIGLAVLRKGIKYALPACILSGILTWYWSLQSHPSALFCLICTVILSHCLRNTVSWITTLMLFVGLAIIVTISIDFFYLQSFQQIIANVQQKNPKIISHLVENVDNKSLNTNTILTNVLLKGYTFASLISCLIALLLARNWQAKLYNPGGLQKEMSQLCLPSHFATILFITWLLGLFTNNAFIQALMPSFFLPLILAGMAMIHGLTAKLEKKNAQIIIITVYLLIIFIYPVIATLAFLDSLINFRKKIT